MTRGGGAEVASVIAHTCKFRPARIPMRGGRIVSDKEPSAPRANISRTTRRGLPMIPGNARGNRRKKINERRRERSSRAREDGPGGFHRGRALAGKNWQRFPATL